MLPNFMCIGAQKAGTTTLWHLLDAHPDICMARPRETRFFSEPLRYAEGPPAYELRHFGHWKGERAVGEKCPEYLYVPEVAERVHASLGPDLKFLICLRSPAQRAYSHYRHNLVQLRESRPFEAVLADEAEAADAVPPPYGYLGRSRYAEQLERWFDRFGADRCHIISFDAIAGDQAAVAREMFAFLGVPPRPPAQAVHAGHPPLEEMSLRLEGTSLVLERPAVPSRSWRARIRRKLGHPDPRTETVRIRNPSPVLRTFAERVEALQPLPPALPRGEELRINRLYFAADLARLAPMVPFDIAAWLE